jgi:hypothetical protein
VGLRSVWSADEFSYAILGNAGKANRQLNSTDVLLAHGGIQLTFTRRTASQSAQLLALPEYIKRNGLARHLAQNDRSLTYPYVEDNVLGDFGSWLGFGLAHWNVNNGNPAPLFSTEAGMEVTIPAWFPMLLLAILPAIWLKSRNLKRKRKLLGLCPKCGYDLRASPKRCPECGTPVDAGGGPFRRRRPNRLTRWRRPVSLQEQRPAFAALHVSRSSITCYTMRSPRMRAGNWSPVMSRRLCPAPIPPPAPHPFYMLAAMFPSPSSPSAACPRRSRITCIAPLARRPLPDILRR